MSEFKIDGPGEYRTRDGRKYIVVHVREDECGHPVMGYWWPNGGTETHRRNGTCNISDAISTRDIVAKWETPEAELPDLLTALGAVIGAYDRSGRSTLTIAMFRALVAHIEALHARRNEE